MSLSQQYMLRTYSWVALSNYCEREKYLKYIICPGKVNDAKRSIQKKIYLKKSYSRQAINNQYAKYCTDHHSHSGAKAVSGGWVVKRIPYNHECEVTQYVVKKLTEF